MNLCWKWEAVGHCGVNNQLQAALDLRPGHAKQELSGIVKAIGLEEKENVIAS